MNHILSVILIIFLYSNIGVILYYICKSIKERQRGKRIKYILLVILFVLILAALAQVVAAHKFP